MKLSGFNQNKNVAFCRLLSHQCRFLSLLAASTIMSIRKLSPFEGLFLSQKAIFVSLIDGWKKLKLRSEIYFVSSGFLIDSLTRIR